MPEIFQEKYLIWFVAVLVGVLMIIPSFYFHYFDPAYRGIELFGSDAESDYLAQIQEIYDGHWFSGNIYLADQKDALYFKQNLSPIIMALFGKAAGLSAAGINMAAKFFLPALLTVLIYIFFANVFGRKDLAILMAVFIMLTQATWALLNPASWPAIFLDGRFPGTDSHFLNYSRPINPQISSFFFFGYLLCLWKFLFSPIADKLKNIFIAVGVIILGLSFYTYPFTYSFLFAMNGSLFAYFLFVKDWRSLKKIIYVSLGAIAVGSVYLVSLFKVIFSDFYAQAAMIAGVVDTHRFIFSRVWWGTTAIFLFLYKGSKQTKVFILAFLAAAFLVTNQQLITGRTAPVPAHYHWYYIAPVSGAILLYLLFIYLEKIIGRFKSALLTAFLVLVFFYAGFLFQKNSYIAQREGMVSIQRYADVISWIKNSIPEESSILSNEKLANLIVDYTNHNVYDSGYAVNFLISPERLRHLYYSGLFLDGITKNNAGDYFYNNKDFVGGYFFGQYYRYKNGGYGNFPDFVLDGIITEYENFLDEDFLGQLSKYPLDYIVWDKEKDPSWRIDRFFHEKVYEKNSIIIYKI
ncbi:MAG: hypothetical protein AAB674_00885 [Patescibacteria group bacterium]